jgi:2-keto-4-pentenoate hydratase
MTDEAWLARQLAEVLRAKKTGVDSAPYRDLDFSAALRVQALVQKMSGEDVVAAKVAVPVGYPAMGTPIPGSMVSTEGKAVVSARLVEGIEVEVAVVLGRDLTPAIAEQGEDAVVETIDRFIVGVELVGSRFSDRLSAGLMAELADNLSSAGYVTDLQREWTHGTDLTNAEVEVTLNDKVLYSAPAKHVFGDVLRSLVAYARQPTASLPLRAGLIVTTGTLCGLINIPDSGRVVASLADHAINLDFS